MTVDTSITKGRPQKMKISCFGDSNTYGYDPRSYFGGRYDADSRWVDILAAQTGWTIFNMGQKEGVMVPDVAVQKQVGTAERFVYVIEGDSVARRRRVDVGRQVGDRVDILSGVGADEAVAVTALSKLYDGAKVEIKQE